jgi:hypothetical protein
MKKIHYITATKRNKILILQKWVTNVFQDTGKNQTSLASLRKSQKFMKMVP